MWKVLANSKQEVEEAVNAAVTGLNGPNTYIVTLEIADEPTEVGEPTPLKDGDER